MSESRLAPTLSLGPAIGLAVTLVVGSGVLVLPGLAYDERGAAAVWSWIAAAIVCMPLLVVVATLGGRYPAAGGIAGFVRPALGERTAAVAELLLLAAIPAGAGLALVAGHLVADLAERSWLVTPVAVAALVVAGATALQGAAFSGGVVRALVAIFVVVLLTVSIAALVHGGDGVGTGSWSDATDGIRGIRVVFFAFVGWELMSFLSEEFVDPARDFPRMVAASFVLVVGLYLALATAAQVALAPDDPHLTTSPVATMAEVVFGRPGRLGITVVGLLIVAANVNSVVLAFSRLVFATARNGRLPRRLAADATASDDASPRRAVLATVAVFAACLVPERLGVLSQARLFELAGSAFFAGLLLAAVAFTAEAGRAATRSFGIVTCVVAAAVLASFGWVALYPVAVGAAGIVATRPSHRPGAAGATA